MLCTWAIQHPPPTEDVIESQSCGIAVMCNRFTKCKQCNLINPRCFRKYRLPKCKMVVCYLSILVYGPSINRWTSFESCLTKRSDDFVWKKARMRSLINDNNTTHEDWDWNNVFFRYDQVRLRASEYVTLCDHTTYRNVLILKFPARWIDTVCPRNEKLEKILKLDRESTEIVHKRTQGSSTYASSSKKTRGILSWYLTPMCDRLLFCKTLDFPMKDMTSSRLSSERETEYWNTSSPTWQATSIRMIVRDQQIL